MCISFTAAEKTIAVAVGRHSSQPCPSILSTPDFLLPLPQPQGLHIFSLRFSPFVLVFLLFLFSSVLDDGRMT
jgi:hypothetical protein